MHPRISRHQEADDDDGGDKKPTSTLMNYVGDLPLQREQSKVCLMGMWKEKEKKRGICRSEGLKKCPGLVEYGSNYFIN